MTTSDAHVRYQQALQALIAGTQALVGLADIVDLQGMRRFVSQREALGPLLQRTSPRGGGDLSLTDQARLIDATIAYVDILKELDRGGGG